MCLKIKIFSGYIILIFLLVLTICLFRKEQMKRNYLQQDEQELLHFWHLTGEAYAGLLNLATYGETVSVWDENDRSTYQKRRNEVCGILQSLKQYVHASGQRGRIDSLCLLLERKEQLLDTVMHTFSRFREAGEIINRKMRSISAMRKRLLKSKRKFRRKVSGPSSNARRENPFIRNRRKNGNGCNLLRKKTGRSQLQVYFIL